jgi:hypothetical protein
VIRIEAIVPDLGRFTPALVLAIAFGIVAGPVWARVAGTRLLLGVATTVSIGGVLALTLAPAGPLPDTGFVIGVCDLRRWGPGTLEELTVIGEASLNVLLFMPLGACLALQPEPVVRRMGLALAAVLPFAIELAQLELPALGRYCDSMDIADNLVGLAFGFAVGAALAMLWRAMRGGSRPSDGALGA